MTVPATAMPTVFKDADQTTKLKAFATSGACESGAVLALDFAAIRVAMKDRWVTRRQDVHDRIEREISRQLARSAVFLRMSETEYLLSFTEATGAAAQLRAFNIMEDLLTHFLGRCDPQDLVVKCVSAVTEDGVEMRSLSRADVERASRRHEAGISAAVAARPAASAFIEGPAERLSIRVEPQDIIHIGSGLNIETRTSISLYRLGAERQLSVREEHALTTNSLLQTNILIIDSVHALMKAARRPAVFILPLYLQPMASSRGRTIILDELRQFHDLDQRRLIIEIAGIERGTPTSRLVETSWQLRPFCRAISGRVQLERSTLAALTGAGLSGIHVSARDLGVSPSQVAAGLLAAGQSVRGRAQTTVAVDLPDTVALSICEVAGFTHATVPASIS